MKRLAIIGDPIGHSLSPAMYNAAFPAMGIDARYEAWPTPPSELPAAIRKLRGEEMMGMNVTVPHKAAVMPLIDAVEDTASSIGAVNCLVKDAEGRITGHNTDRYGFIRSLREAGCDPAGIDAVVLGAGGSAHAVAYALAEAGAGSLAVANRSRGRLEAFASHFEATAPHRLQLTLLGWRDDSVTSACRAAGLIVNCTSVGMSGTAAVDDSPLAVGDITAGSWCYDLVYRPIETVFLRQALAAGARPIAGLGMLVYQAVESVRLWTGRDGPVDIMRSAARAELGLDA
jgi:shikimate dehydrogenase